MITFTSDPTVSMVLVACCVGVTWLNVLLLLRYRRLTDRLHETLTEMQETLAAEIAQTDRMIAEFGKQQGVENTHCLVCARQPQAVHPMACTVSPSECPHRQAYLFSRAKQVWDKFRDTKEGPHGN